MRVIHGVIKMAHPYDLSDGIVECQQTLLDQSTDYILTPGMVQHCNDNGHLWIPNSPLVELFGTTTGAKVEPDYIHFENFKA